MSDKPRTADPEVALWGWAVKIGFPLAAGAILYMFARQGDALALTILVVAGTVLLIGIGIAVTLLIMDRMNEREELRFRENMVENLRLTSQMQQIQGAQTKSLLDQNVQMRKLLPDPNSINVRQGEAVSWHVYDEDEQVEHWRR